MKFRWPVFKFGTSSILAQTQGVASALGPNRGFILMVLALFAAPMSWAMMVVAYTLFLPRFEPASAAPRKEIPRQAQKAPEEIAPKPKADPPGKPAVKPAAKQHHKKNNRKSSKPCKH